MRIQQRSGHLGAGRVLVLAVVLAAPGRVCGAEPLEMICAAFRAASQGLTSGIGKGTYRHYEAFTGRDWQLKQDAGLTTYFDGKKYHIELKRIEIRQTPGGDLVGSYPLVNTDRVRVRFECPRNSGFNLARKQVFNVGQAEPAEDVRIRWKQSPNGLWYVRSIDKTDVSRDPRIPVPRIRHVLKYTEFQPNAKVDPKLFLEAALGLPSRSPILDHRPGAKNRFRLVP